MRMIIGLLTTLAAMAALPVAAAAQPKGKPAADSATALAPFVGNDTIAIARVDLARVDARQAERWLADVVRATQMQPAQQDQAIERLRGSVQLAGQWLADLGNAGGENLFVVVNASQGRGVPSAAVVVPVGAGDDAQAIQKLLEPKGDQPVLPAQPKAEQMHGAIVLAAPDTLKLLETAKPADTQSLAQALKTVDGAGLQVAVTPNQQFRQAVRNLSQNLLGVQPEQAIPNMTHADKVEWAAIGIHYPQQQAVKVVIEATDAQAAQDLAQKMTQTLESARQNGQLDQNAPQLASSIEVLKPNVRGQRVEVSLTDEEANRLFKQGLAPALRVTPTTEPAGAAGASGGNKNTGGR